MSLAEESESGSYYEESEEEEYDEEEEEETDGNTTFQSWRTGAQLFKIPLDFCHLTVSDVNDSYLKIIVCKGQEILTWPVYYFNSRHKVKNWLSSGLLVQDCSKLC